MTFVNKWCEERSYTAPVAPGTDGLYLVGVAVVHSWFLDAIHIESRDAATMEMITALRTHHRTSRRRKRPTNQTIGFLHHDVVAVASLASGPQPVEANMPLAALGPDLEDRFQNDLLQVRMSNSLLSKESDVLQSIRIV